MDLVHCVPLKNDTYISRGRWMADAVMQAERLFGVFSDEAQSARDRLDHENQASTAALRIPAAVLANRYRPLRRSLSSINSARSTPPGSWWAGR